MEQLITDQRLDGEFAISRDVGPELLAAVVDQSRASDAEQAIEELCCYWGGGCSVLLPADHQGSIQTPFLDLVTSARLDQVCGRGIVEGDDEMKRSFDFWADFSPHTESLPTILATQDRDQRPSVEVALPAPENPWRMAYVGCLGIWSQQPAQRVLERSRLAHDLDWNELLDCETPSVESPGGQDLLKRLRSTWSPRRTSLIELGLAAAPWSTDFASEPRWTQRDWMKQFIGTNVVVIYEPGSVPDLALLWDLRSAHGLPAGLPLAIPVSADVRNELDLWSQPEADDLQFAPRLRGFGRPWVLVSMSVERERLEPIADQASGPWRTLDAGELLQAPHRPSRRSHDVARFRNGRATVAAWDSTDRELIRRRPNVSLGLELRCRIAVQDRPIPPVRSLRSGSMLMAGWRGGGFDFQLGKQTNTVSVEWPSSWAILRSIVAEKGLTVRPSVAGLAASALLMRLASFDQVEALKDDRVLDQLYRLGERSGISWFRARVREIQAGLTDDEATTSRLESLLKDLVVPPVEDEQHELTSSRLAESLGRDGARSWVAWAEGVGIVVRGVRVGCDECGTSGWRPVADVAPPIACAGCGNPISRPFPPDTLTFHYRASRLLIEVLGSDALSHVLCAAWWVALFRSGGLLGVHPGVELIDNDGRVVGEIDLVLLLADGRIALGECKRSPAGLTDGDLARLELLADRLDAAWTFVATPAWAADAPQIWRELRRDLPERRLFALTAEQVLRPAEDIVSLLGEDITAWDPLTSKGRKEREDRFEKTLVSTISRLEQPSSLADWLLGDS